MAAMRAGRRGPPLPYRLLAGAVPCSRGWLVLAGKLQGITLSPDAPEVLPRFLDVLDYKPAFQVIALFAPVGLHDRADDRADRSCERAARQLLGWPRSGAVSSAPLRESLNTATFDVAAGMNGGHLSPATWRELPHIAEVDKYIAPYWQRTVFEVHPELSFYQLNLERPMRHSIYSRDGKDERRRLLLRSLPGMQRVLEARVADVTPSQLLQVAACLWTARRITARAITRLPESPEWDRQGLRMEYVF